ncbi:LysR family transcriptional regulator [Granulicella sp. 5B5]|uniref:LysR substrate-binding domain-containing protein n=1 Tax=Granulicella sp. 5B5 TaxID=1617967 RepID=UPI0015F4FD00|nr:LysR substrate-binding domain-containing protein [Granulicella sp. 5B5]QMV19005.1 LysR family transcriptional regulator [Granulicella sp. 5B5]
MELKHLKSFLAVAERLSFIRAAEHLHLSQPALSAQIQNLEEELGVKLLYRTRRVVRLTPEGEIFIEEARATLARAERAIQRVQKASRGEVGQLRIAFVSSAALEIVPHIVTLARRKLPEVSLDIRNMRTSLQLQSFRDNAIDVGFLRLPLQDDSLRLQVIHREPFVIVLPASHPLARRDRIKLADLRSELFVAYGRHWAPGFFDAIIRLCTDAGFSPNIVQETGEMYTATALVAAGVGVAILPRSIVLSQRQDIAIKPISPKLAVSEIAIATRKDRDTPMLRAFLAIATSCSRL